MLNKNPIDFVILWVDGADPEWRAEKAKYQTNKGSDDNRDFRFRDWDNLQYVFRGIENFTPWVRKIHFVTWGHLPKWLDTKNPKLHIVNHKDFMDSKYLPSFNSEAIESCLHKIPGLSDNFVYFNDDMFILKKMDESDFFQNDKPCDSAILNVHCCELEDGGTLCNFLNIGIINKYFSMKDVLKKNWMKWFNLKYGVNVLRTIYLLPCPRFPGLLMEHLPQSFNKSTFEKVWEKENVVIDNTCSHKFRCLDDTNQWLFKEWQLVTGEFVPRKCKLGVSIGGIRDIDYGCKVIEKQKYKFLVYNDEDISYEEFELAKKKINTSFQKILPMKSSFEL